jgi:hypothetical protein
MLFRPSGTNSNSEIPEFRNPRTLLCNFGNSKFVPKIFTEYARSRVSRNFGENRDIFGHFFRNVTNLQKCAKNKKNAKITKKTSKTPEILGVLSKIGLWRFVEDWKVSKMTPKIPMHTPCTLSKIPEGHFGVFGTFNLESISEKKGVFDVFGKIFTFCVLPAGGRRPHFYMGRKSELRFFRKVRNTFSVLGPILCCFTRKIRPDENDDTDYL